MLMIARQSSLIAQFTRLLWDFTFLKVRGAPNIFQVLSRFTPMHLLSRREQHRSWRSVRFTSLENVLPVFLGLVPRQSNTKRGVCFCQELFYVFERSDLVKQDENISAIKMSFGQASPATKRRLHRGHPFRRAALGGQPPGLFSNSSRGKLHNPPAPSEASEAAHTSPMDLTSLG